VRRGTVTTDCEETGNVVTAQTCTYHDHLDALTLGFLGTIVIME